MGRQSFDHKDLVRKEAMSNIEIIICTEQGYLESLSKLLVDSLRSFGGAFKDIPIYSYQPRKHFKISSETIKWFEEHQVEYIDTPLNKKWTHYPLANKPLACAYHEERSNSKRLIFLDSDIFFLGEPKLFDLSDDYDASLRPLDLCKISGATDFNHPNGNYWQQLYALLKVNSDRRVTSTVDDKDILEYYNSGHVVIQKKNELFQHWLENFHKVMEAKLTLPNGHFYVEQSVLSATISQLDLNILESPKNYNFPIHLVDQMVNENYKLDSAQELISVHYHKLFQNSAASNPMKEFILGHHNGAYINEGLMKYNVLQSNIPQNNYVNKVDKKWRQFKSRHF